MIPLMKKITIGSDPEFFVMEGNTVKSGIGLIGGTKEKPRPVEYGAVQEDNVLAELNIDPATTEDEFVSNLIAVRTTLDLLLPDGFYTKVITSHEYTEEEINRFGDKAKEFGCDPDINAYTETMNEPPSAQTLLRTAGGHIHVGYTNPNPFASFDIVKMMDVLLGIPSVIMDQDSRRRTMYGAAGACRIKNYGVEYRTLSNFWLDKEQYMRWAFRNARRAAEVASEWVDEETSTTMGVPWEDVQSIINNSDKARALELVKELDLEVE